MKTGSEINSSIVRAIHVVKALSVKTLVFIIEDKKQERK